jgi:hypothetical protein
MGKKVVPPNRKKGIVPDDSGPKGRTEKDPDDLVHSTEHETPSDQPEDPDDLVHRKSPKKIEDDSMEDPDDLVHDNPEDEDDR